MKEMKVRLPEDKADDIRLWLASGSARISFTRLVELLVSNFHAEVMGQESTLEVVSKGLKDSVKVTKIEMERRRFG
jgi:hypothetical protein